MSMTNLYNQAAYNATKRLKAKYKNEYRKLLTEENQKLGIKSKQVLSKEEKISKLKRELEKLQDE